MLTKGGKMKIFAKLLFIVFLFLSIVACDQRYGFIESEFKLSPDSKLPKFVSIANGINSNNLLVTITIYSNPFTDKAKVIVYTTFPEHKILYDKVGNFRWHPFTEKQFKKQNRYDVYPQYMIIKVNNTEEIFEQKNKGDVLYAADEP